MKVSSFLAEQIRDIVSSAIIDALEEDGDALEVAQQLREQLKAGWLAGLENSGMPPELAARLDITWWLPYPQK